MTVQEHCDFTQISMSEEIQVEEDWKYQHEAIIACLYSADITNFLNWNVIRWAMFSIPPETVLWYLQKLPDWKTKWKEAIIESPVGNPPPYKAYPASSGNIITHALNLSFFLSQTDCKLEKLNAIFEFGGGYGCLCRLMHRLGFSGEYTSLDLPALIHLQRYYLSRTVNEQITFLEDADEFSEKLVVNRGNSLFVAMWSISEAPLSLREKILDAVCINTDYVFICFQSQHKDFDNMAIFMEFAEKNINYQWKLGEVPYLIITGAKHYYLFGERK